MYLKPAYNIVSVWKIVLKSMKCSKFFLLKFENFTRILEFPPPPAFISFLLVVFENLHFFIPTQFPVLYLKNPCNNVLPLPEAFKRQVKQSWCLSNVFDTVKKNYLRIAQGKNNGGTHLTADDTSVWEILFSQQFRRRHINRIETTPSCAYKNLLK